MPSKYSLVVIAHRFEIRFADPTQVKNAFVSNLLTFLRVDGICWFNFLQIKLVTSCVDLFPSMVFPITPLMKIEQLPKKTPVG